MSCLDAIRPARARWQVCHVCACTDVLVVVGHVGPIICYECVCDGYRYEPGDFDAKVDGGPAVIR